MQSYFGGLQTLCIPVGIGRSLNLTPRLARAHSMPIHRTRGASTWKGITTICQLPSAPGFERTEASGDDSIACQRTFVGNSLNDEQWSDHLSKPS